MALGIPCADPMGSTNGGSYSPARQLVALTTFSDLLADGSEINVRDGCFSGGDGRRSATPTAMTAVQRATSAYADTIITYLAFADRQVRGPTGQTIVTFG